MKTSNEVYAKDRNQWRTWLQENHSTSNEVWLIFYKKASGKPSVGYEEAVEEALCFGWIDSLKKSVDSIRYKQKFTPRKKGSLWSESNKKRVNRLIKDGLMREPGMVLIKQAQKDGSWHKISASKQPIDPPQEFVKALQENTEAYIFFQSLAPSYQKQFIVWIGSAKRQDTRLKRTEESISLLANKQKLGLK